MLSPLVRYILSCVEAYGIPASELLPAWRAQWGHAPQRQPTSDDFADLFRTMTTLRDDPLLGLHVGQAMPFRAFSPVVYLVLSSASLAQSVGTAIRFADILEGRDSKLFTRETPHGQEVGWTDLSPTEECRHQHEFIAVALHKAFVWLRGHKVPLKRVQFIHPSPGHTDAYRDIFGVRPTFDAPRHSSLTIWQDTWRGRSVHADPTTARVQEDILAQTQQHLRETQVAQRVRHAVRARLSSGAPIDVVARDLAMSRRTLQRRLGDLDTSYRALVDDVRREEVQLALRVSNTSIDAIASAVGLSDARSLHRAFLRWTGTTPQAWRDAQRSED